MIHRILHDKAFRVRVVVVSLFLPMSRGSWFALGFVSGFVGCAGLAVLLRRLVRRQFDRMTGLEQELRSAALHARTDTKRKVAAQIARQQEVSSVASCETLDKHFVGVQLAVLALLNQESMSSKNFTFWQRRTAKIQQDIDKLRADNEVL